MSQAIRISNTYVTAAGSFSPETSTALVCNGKLWQLHNGQRILFFVEQALLASPKGSGSCSACTFLYYLPAIRYYQ